MEMTTLTAKAAADYIGFDGKDPERQFKRAVERGELPEPVIKSRPPLWSLAQIDKALSGELKVTQGDNLMERINGLS